MLVSVIIVNYNTFQLTSQCIRSLYAHVRSVAFEVVLVDNASTETDPGRFLEAFPDIRLIKSRSNLGFAGGNNLGIGHASGDLILLLNSDTYLDSDCVSYAAAKLEGDDSLGAVTVRILYPDGRFQHTARRFRSIGRELLDLARPLLYLVPYRKRAALMLNQYFKGDFDTGCDWVSGAFMMFRREAVNRMPARQLDDRFFMYGEDQLWCLQFRERGYRNFFFSGACVYHLVSASTSARKQLQLKKLMIARELEIMQYRKGRSLYFYLFSAVFVPKEYLIYGLKRLAQMVKSRNGATL